MIGLWITNASGEHLVNIHLKKTTVSHSDEICREQNLFNVFIYIFIYHVISSYLFRSMVFKH